MNIVEKRMRDIAKNKRQARIETLKNSLESSGVIIKDDSFAFIDDLSKDIAKLGLPYYKHNMGSKAYIASAKKLARVFKKYRFDVLDVFALGHEYFNNSNFVFRPKRISIGEFIKFTPEFLNFNEYAKFFSRKYKVRSLFNEFVKGRDYIDSKYLKKKMAKVEDALLIELIKIWSRYKKQVKDSEKRILADFIAICKEYSEINERLSVRAIFFLLEDDILSKQEYNISHINFLVSRAFWNELLPEVIVRYGLYNNKIYLRKLERHNE